MKLHIKYLGIFTTLLLIGLPGQAQEEQLMATGEFRQFQGAVLLSIVIVLYVFVGGMRSVALADVIQGSLLLTGMLVAGFVAISALGGVRDYFASLGDPANEVVHSRIREALLEEAASGRRTGTVSTGRITVRLVGKLILLRAPCGPNLGNGPGGRFRPRWGRCRW